ncbi:transmembrane protein DUF3566 [Nocardiopsis sp. Huas11]|uniref:DUF3566 domain-containing protein n=1 Tax=Nocardiopsis sp. Huas11 TaxID=2183912 RepID=UPI000EAFC227|nr:DUF3566 domain-containing protein [Nocardiopsis sp. Huas11]RKS06606.1 transmembrane protein DUF3566 [Nocardiopsis sp. Huas11]
MSENQRNTTTNESDSDAPETAAPETGAVDTTESDTDTVADTSEESAADEAGESTETATKDAVAEEPEAGAAEAADRAEEADKAEKAAAAGEVQDGDKVEAVEDSAEAGGIGKPAGSEKTAAGSAAAVTAPGRGEAERDSVNESVADRTEAGEAPVTDPKDASPQGTSAVKATLSSRKAHLTVSRVEPWSVMKFSFVVSLVCFIVLFVAITVIYVTLSMLGVFDEMTNMINALLEGDGAEDELGLNPAAWFSPGRVLGYTGVVGALNIVLITALSTVSAMLYNLVADLVGGVDVTLSEAE